jgi:hypothetical protein
MKGIFAIDPGVHTGVAWAVVDETSQTVVAAMCTRVDTGSATLEGSEMEQAILLFELWQKFKTQCVRVRKMLPSDVQLVIEDFSLIPGAHAGGKDGVAPCRYGWAFEGYRQGRAAKFSSPKHTTKVVWQLPGAVQEKKHLRKCDAWIVGKDHERAAFCHIIRRLRKVIR